MIGFVVITVKLWSDQTNHLTLTHQKSQGRCKVLLWKKQNVHNKFQPGFKIQKIWYDSPFKTFQRIIAPILSTQIQHYYNITFIFYENIFYINLWNLDTSTVEFCSIQMCLFIFFLCKTIHLARKIIIKNTLRILQVH